MPDANTAGIVQHYGDFLFGKDNVHIGTLRKELKQAFAAINGGDMTAVENMLLGQATALQIMFTNLSIRANCQDRLDQTECLTKLALKAQNQCRMTLETLSNVKHPPVVYARQANITSGPQQVNNGMTHVGEKTVKQNELLEDDHVKRLDGGTQSEASPIDPQMEAVAVCGSENT